jgi:uncharacterized repeat protein (TIGR01451 family)
MMHASTRVLAAVAVAAVLFQPSARAQTGSNLTIAISHTGNFTVGVNGTYTIVVSNIGGTASGTVQVLDQFQGISDSLPFTFVSAVGTGWSCSYFIGFPNEHLTCDFLPPTIAPGGSTPPITLTVLPCCVGTATNTVSVSGGATASDPTIVLAGVPTLPQWALIALTVCLALAGVVAMRRRTT